MVDVSNKSITKRIAKAHSSITVNEDDLPSNYRQYK